MIGRQNTTIARIVAASGFIFVIQTNETSCYENEDLTFPKHFGFSEFQARRQPERYVLLDAIQKRMKLSIFGKKGTVIF
jgi:hypothetical protein